MKEVVTLLFHVDEEEFAALQWPTQLCLNQKKSLSSKPSVTPTNDLIFVLQGENILYSLKWRKFKDEDE